MSIQFSGGIINIPDTIIQESYPLIVNYNVQEEATAVVIQSTVNCDDRWDLIDAVLIKQYDAIIAVATTDCTLPLTNQAVYLPECDVNSDDVCGLVEAVIIQQCNAGLVNPFCTDLE